MHDSLYLRTAIGSVISARWIREEHGGGCTFRTYHYKYSYRSKFSFHSVLSHEYALYLLRNSESRMLIRGKYRFVEAEVGRRRGDCLALAGRGSVENAPRVPRPLSRSP